MPLSSRHLQLPLEGPKGDLVFLDLATEGNYVACRPSGTEPKIKFYMFTYTPPEQLANLDAAKAQLEERLDRMEADLRKFRGRVKAIHLRFAMSHRGRPHDFLTRITYRFIVSSRVRA